MKVYSLNNLPNLVKELKKDNKKIVFANGCFDILHVGHTRYLEQAKSLGDILIVGINDDESESQLKGHGRPIMQEEDRIEIVAALECVNYVVLFSDLTVENLLKIIKPAIHAKGTDYTAETVPERDIVLSYGGQIAITGDKKNHSTTDIIKKIQQQL
ncbi:MAG: D-glycero-beta-D-manno-heptose 1-phosphate adenylyltransferase [bacterium]|nr:D-glycero-beta-D-manno-heptose 1-phosphate adenylyltransferase [bacterium]